MTEMWQVRQLEDTGNVQANETGSRFPKANLVECMLVIVFHYIWSWPWRLFAIMLAVLGVPCFLTSLSPNVTQWVIHSSDYVTGRRLEYFKA